MGPQRGLGSMVPHGIGPHAAWDTLGLGHLAGPTGQNFANVDTGPWKV
uniref:Uncharacterized protein n=1 Tax=Arundo donax TaxID=35708 RepID=A0A0A9BHS9_ARUDO